MNDEPVKSDQDLCANRECGHERSRHWEGICHAKTVDPPFVCLCASFQEPATQSKQKALTAADFLRSRLQRPAQS